MIEKKVVYALGKTPDWYWCAGCGAGKIKLWRPHLTEKQTLLCAVCAAKDQFRSIAGINEDGKYISSFGLTDQIGIFVPAIPMKSGLEYWVYSKASPEANKWWRSLPTLK